MPTCPPPPGAAPRFFTSNSSPVSSVRNRLRTGRQEARIQSGLQGSGNNQVQTSGVLVSIPGICLVVGDSCECEVERVPTEGGEGEDGLEPVANPPAQGAAVLHPAAHQRAGLEAQHRPSLVHLHLHSRTIQLWRYHRLLTQPWIRW